MTAIYCKTDPVQNLGPLFSTIWGFSKISNTVIFKIITFLIQNHFKTVTVTVIFGEISSNDIHDGNWESMEMKG